MPKEHLHYKFEMPYRHDHENSTEVYLSIYHIYNNVLMLVHEQVFQHLIVELNNHSKVHLLLHLIELHLQYNNVLRLLHFSHQFYLQYI